MNTTRTLENPQLSLEDQLCEQRGMLRAAYFRLQESQIAINRAEIRMAELELLLRSKADVIPLPTAAKKFVRQGRGRPHKRTPTHGRLSLV